ncbi:acetoin dehydrogenase dihydrolipoyllysine-residue acetyltransferase subunit [Mesorhizobium tianshanense]|uniref:Pyruvate dehydrogenase E2 component (Dihydrolipoamide acetyltransferase) n=1 Tax=Mesorhizobium tianshanense TaxID=39844 RepID=A0A562P3E8_9HYPH|nr:acetoin dehydrogenase dihydrolipoyllysine-residue acetyltransferase subunit [Mesorhizobium tianshanense]TWI38770.1 pyruvate dehydrogenase E2 component (dihydrolipoamide acetyltransferase) [Mesorhizobium tianshanense]GLS36704.1 acetoin dehydrogenase dihydrolipoyllysine-residue acetyltransferase subunit [Mesorhizobium tianshanense]
MPIDVCYPKVSLEVSTGKISRWLVENGEEVKSGAILFEIDNDKAAVEVEAPAAGRVCRLIASDIEVDVGAEVARIFLEGEPYETAAIIALQPATTSKQDAPVGPLIEGTTSKRPPNPTPLARRIARENNINLDNVVGTGPRGRIVRDDVLPIPNAGSGAQAPAARNIDVPSTRPMPAHNRSELLNSTWMRHGEGFPIVLLHGLSADLNIWRGMLACGRVNAPVLALDLPAHGRSPRDTPVDLDDVATAVERTLADIGVGPSVLCGHSFGAALATRIALRAQVDCRAICLFSPAGLGPKIDGDLLNGILHARTAESLRPWLEYLCHEPSRITDAFLAAVVQQRKDHGLTEAMEKFSRRFFRDATQTFSIRGDLAAISHPVRVVFGLQDRILSVASTRGLPGNVALHLLDSCGHMPQIERPDLALTILQELWRSA